MTPNPVPATAPTDSGSDDSGESGGTDEGPPVDEVDMPGEGDDDDRGDVPPQRARADGEGEPEGSGGVLGGINFGIDRRVVVVSVGAAVAGFIIWRYLQNSNSSAKKQLEDAVADEDDLEVDEVEDDAEAEAEDEEPQPNIPDNPSDPLAKDAAALEFLKDSEG